MITQVGWNGPIAIPQLILLFRQYAILRHQQQPYLFIQAICIAMVWVPLQIYLHHLSHCYRGPLVNNWRSTLRSCASFSLCSSTLIEMACLYVNYHLIPFSINIFIVILSGACIFVTFPHNILTIILSGLWNAAALAALVWIVLLTDEKKSGATITMHQQTQENQQHWLYFLLCLDFFSCPITVSSSSNHSNKKQTTTASKLLPQNTLFQKITGTTSLPPITTTISQTKNNKQENTNGFLWHIICLLVFVVIIASQEENKIQFWDFHIDLRIDSTFHDHISIYNSQMIPTTIVQWTTLLFLLPVIIQTQRHIFSKITLPSTQAIDSQQQQYSFLLHMKTHQRKKLNIQSFGFIITFTVTCVLVLGLNATFYSPARLIILSIHAILQWSSHLSCLVSYITTAKTNNKPTPTNLTMLKP